MVPFGTLEMQIKAHCAILNRTEMPAIWTCITDVSSSITATFSFLTFWTVVVPLMLSLYWNRRLKLIIKHTHTHTHTLRLLLRNTLSHCSELVSSSWAVALIDALTWRSCQWKWQIHFANFILQLPAKPKIPRCRHHTTTHHLPPDRSLPSGLALASWDLVTYFCHLCDISTFSRLSVGKPSL